MTRMLDPDGRLVICQRWLQPEPPSVVDRIGGGILRLILYGTAGLMCIGAVYLVLNSILVDAQGDVAVQALVVFITFPLFAWIAKLVMVDCLSEFFHASPRHLADPARRELVLETPGIIKSTVRRIPAADVAEIATLVEHLRESTGYDPIDQTSHQLVARLRSGEIVRLGGANVTSVAGAAPPPEMLATRGDIVAALGYADDRQPPLAGARSLSAPEVLAREYGFVDTEIDLGRRYLFLSTRPRSWFLARGLRYYAYASVAAWLALCALQAWDLLWLGFLSLVYILAFAEVMQTYRARALTFDGQAKVLTMTETAGRYGFKSTVHRVVPFGDIRQIVIGAPRHAEPPSALYLHSRTRQVDIMLSSGERLALYEQTRLSPERTADDPLLPIVNRLIEHAEIVDHA